METGHTVETAGIQGIRWRQLGGTGNMEETAWIQDIRWRQLGYRA